MDYKELSMLLTDRWEEILGMYGIDVPKITNKNSKNHPCPCCGGNDRAHWREVDGRLALYCRNCAPKKMKSPEDVIMEACNIGFHELCNNLMDFAGQQRPEDIKKAVDRSKAKPTRNTPVNHKQDHDKARSFMEKQSFVERHYILDRFSVQYPSQLAAQRNAIFFDIRNESGVITNVFAVFDKGGKIETSYLAGGISFGCYHTIAQCEVREAPGIAYGISAIDCLKHYWRTGQETRIVFDMMNLVYMVNIYQINLDKDTLLISEQEKNHLPVQASELNDKYSNQ